MNKIIHLEDIKNIRKLEQQVYNETQIPTYDISHWNAGTQYKELLLSNFEIDCNLDFSNYHYSYEYEEKVQQAVACKLLNIPDCQYNCVFIHSATAAICCISDYLNKHGYKKVCVIDPSYFSIYSCLLSFGLNVQKESLILDGDGHCVLPYQTILQKGYDAVWITSPIFSTGIYYEESQVLLMEKLVQNNILLIIDESAAAPHQTLTDRLPTSNNIIAFFSPHKYLSINSIKFAAILCSGTVKAYLEDWIDVFIGSLPISACAAIQHYLSPNFSMCASLHNKHIMKNKQLVDELCCSFPNNYYRGIGSTYITIQNSRLPYQDCLDSYFMYNMMQHTHTSFIPGYINGFSQTWGLCYRINLTHDYNMIKSHLGRLFNHFL